MPRMTEAIEAEKTKNESDVVGKILMLQAKEIARAFSLHGLRSSVEFETHQLLKERDAS